MFPWSRSYIWMTCETKQLLQINVICVSSLLFCFFIFSERNSEQMSQLKVIGWMSLCFIIHLCMLKRVSVMREMASFFYSFPVVKGDTFVGRGKRIDCGFLFRVDLRVRKSLNI